MSRVEKSLTSVPESLWIKWGESGSIELWMVSNPSSGIYLACEYLGEKFVQAASRLGSVSSLEVMGIMSCSIPVDYESLCKRMGEGTGWSALSIAARDLYGRDLNRIQSSRDRSTVTLLDIKPPSSAFWTVMHSFLLVWETSVCKDRLASQNGEPRRSRFVPRADENTSHNDLAPVNQAS